MSYILTSDVPVRPSYGEGNPQEIAFYNLESSQIQSDNALHWMISPFLECGEADTFDFSIFFEIDSSNEVNSIPLLRWVIVTDAGVDIIDGTKSAENGGVGNPVVYTKSYVMQNISLNVHRMALRWAFASPVGVAMEVRAVGTIRLYKLQ